MKYEKLKSIILLLLIVSSLVMSAFVWLSEELWPTGYNFFITLKNNNIIRYVLRWDEADSIPKENLSKPQRLIVTNGSKRTVYYNSDVSFDRVFDVVKGFMMSSLSEETKVLREMEVGEDEWHSVLRNDELLDTRYIYVDYSLAFTPRLFAQVLGIKTTWMEQNLSAVKDFIVAPVGFGGSEILLYARDYRGESIYKYYVDYPGADALYSAILDYTEGDTDNYRFSFEQNLHTAEGGVTGSRNTNSADGGATVEQNVLIEPLVIISTKINETDVIESSNPMSVDAGFNQDALLSTFRFPHNAHSHYTDARGVEHFVENYSTLKIHQNGLLEYTSVDEKRGIDVSGEEAGASTLYESLNNAIEFSENVWRSVMPSTPFNVLVTSNLIENSEKPGVYRFTLDYYFGGNPITVDLVGDDFVPMKNAVIIEMANGRITKYRHFIRRYEKTGESVSNIPMVPALDGIINKLRQNEGEIIVSDIFLSYIEKEYEPYKAPVWCAKTSGSDEIITYENGG